MYFVAGTFSADSGLLSFYRTLMDPEVFMRVGLIMKCWQKLQISSGGTAFETIEREGQIPASVQDIPHPQLEVMRAEAEAGMTCVVHIYIYIYIHMWGGLALCEEVHRWYVSSLCCTVDQVPRLSVDRLPALASNGFLITS